MSIAGEFNSVLLGMEALGQEGKGINIVKGTDSLETVGKLVKLVDNNKIGAITATTDSVYGIHSSYSTTRKDSTINHDYANIKTEGNAIPILTTGGDGGFIVGDTVAFDETGLAVKTGLGVCNFKVVAVGKTAYKVNASGNVEEVADVIYVGGVA